MSTSQTERKPSVSTWFSSLRRQPKPRKIIAAKKHLQKSCVDLSTVPSDIKSLPSSVTNSPKLKNGFFQRDNPFCFSPIKLAASKNAAAATASPSTNRTHSLDLCDDSKSVASSSCYSPKARTYSTASTRSSDSNESNSRQTTKKSTTTTKTTSNAKTLTTITRVTKTTVITKQSSQSGSNNRLNRIGTIFDDDGKLITTLNNFDVYKNYADNFRSNIIKTDSTNSNSSDCSSATQPNTTTIHIDNNQSSTTCNNLNTINDTLCTSSCDQSDTTVAALSAAPPKSTAISFISFSDNNDSSKTCGIIANNRPFKSSSLDDDIEFIDSSSSLSDIGTSDGGGIEAKLNVIDNSLYYNTLPKLPKTCATCKSQQQQQQQTKAKSKSDWNLSVRKKVENIQFIA